MTNNQMKTPLERPKILVVDGEKQLLHSLKRALRRSYNHWEFQFCLSSDSAIDILTNFDPWVVIYDKLPLLPKGESFAQYIKQYKPNAVRVLLTGDVSLDTASSGIRSAHFMVAKPFQIEDINNALDRAAVLHQIPISQEVKLYLNQLSSLPVLPETYQKLTKYLEREDAEMEEAANIVKKDQAISVKVMQIANSPFFGFASSSSNLQQAMTRLGVTLIKHLVLVSGLFEQVKTTAQQEQQALFDQAFIVAKLAKSLCLLVNGDKKLADKCYLSGLIHNVGGLVLLNYEQGDVSERDKVNCAHYLLHLWGFSQDIADAVSTLSELQHTENLSDLSYCLYIARRSERCVSGNSDLEQELSILDNRLSRDQILSWFKETILEINQKTT